ncbi:MAG: site-specific DNA-methyltransferase [Candidatus Anammoxibacter sp.]
MYFALLTIFSDMREFLNMDCMEGMKDTPDNFYDLAIVDPPYGLNMAKERPRKDGRFAMNVPRTWDEKIPNETFFKELMRVSKEQIIWGGNYFPLPPHQHFIFWYKQNPVPNFADGELAWTSFKRPAKCFPYRYYGNQEGTTLAPKKIHISQKPVQLYKWLLKNYAQTHFKILSTHVGSASDLIAFEDFGCEYRGYEIDSEYFEAASKRLRQYKSQLKIQF